MLEQTRDGLNALKADYGRLEEQRDSISTLHEEAKIKGEEVQRNLAHALTHKNEAIQATVKLHIDEKTGQTTKLEKSLNALEQQVQSYLKEIQQPKLDSETKAAVWRQKEASFASERPILQR